MGEEVLSILWIFFGGLRGFACRSQLAPKACKGTEALRISGLRESDGRLEWPMQAGEDNAPFFGFGAGGGGGAEP